jgi:2'-5' RNA ligase
MRLFTAIELTDDARLSMTAVQREIAAGLGEASRSLRFVRPEHLHLTLVFAGEIAEDRALAVVEAFRPDIPVAPFQLVFGGVGTFPPRGAPRVVWLGVLEGARAVIDLHALVVQRLAEAGVPTQSRPFSPHLTLARCRESGRRPRLRPSGQPHAIARVDVQAVTLFQSRLSSAGPTYTALAHARLSCP